MRGLAERAVKYWTILAGSARAFGIARHIIFLWATLPVVHAFMF
jgi:hypothetical protein